MCWSFPLILGLLAQAPAPSDLGQVERMRAMREAAGDVVLETIHGGSREKVELLKDPIYRYDDPTRRTLDGAIWAWQGSGRPVALLTLSTVTSLGKSNWLYEFTSLAGVPLSAKSKGPEVWSPHAAEIVLQPFSQATPPAEGEAKRLRQIKELARRFRAYEVFPDVNRDHPGRFELRLLPQPVHRYADPQSGLLDGAIFIIATGTNPEIVLLIEARRAGSSEPSWSFGLARIAGAELHMTLDDKEVWTQASTPGTGLLNPYACFLRPMN